MVDRDARNQLALALRRFAFERGEASEFFRVLDTLTADKDFSLRRRTYTHDAGVHEVAAAVRLLLWEWEDETGVDEYEAKGKELFAGKNREVLVRCILFLQHDSEGRDKHWWKGLWKGLLKFCQSLIWRVEKEAKQAQEVWPFANLDDFCLAKSRPRFLCGN